MPNNWTLDRILKVLLYLGGIILFFFLIFYLSDYLVSFFLALVVAYLLEPIVSFFRFKLKIKNLAVSVLLTFLSLSILITVFGFLLIPQIGQEIVKAKVLISGYTQSEEFGEVSEEVVKTVQEYLNEIDWKKVTKDNDVAGVSGEILNYIWQGISGFFGVFMALFSVITFFLYLIFIMFNYDWYANNWQSAIPPQYRKRVVSLMKDMEREMKIYFRGQSQIVIWVAILFAIGFKIIGMPMAIVLGLLVGFMNFVPYLQIIGIIPAVLLISLHSFETGENAWINIGLVLLVFAVVQAIQEVILNPKIMGDATGLNPAIILLALSIWGGLFGVIGMIIALPVTSLMLIYYKRYVLKTEA